MRTHYHALYLAPHLDDAALSCGGQIYEKTAAGQQVLIVTIMAGDPPAETPHSDFIRELHGRWQLPAGAEAIRRQEDEVACRLLGADFCHWSAPDCIYRTHPVTGELLYPAWADVIGGVHEAEADFIKELAAQMATLPTADMVVAPLGAGHHADHLITRQAAALCFGASLWYYEDFPYVREAGALTAVLTPHPDQWHAQTIPLPLIALAAKANAIAAYASQISTFFKDRLDLGQQLQTYADQVGVERLWQPRFL